MASRNWRQWATLLLFVVQRLFSLLKEVNQLTASKEALTRQAEGAAKAYKAMSEECDQLKKAGGKAPVATPAPAPAPAPSKAPSGGDDADELERLRETVASLRRCKRSARKEGHGVDCPVCHAVQSRK